MGKYLELLSAELNCLETLYITPLEGLYPVMRTKDSREPLHLEDNLHYPHGTTYLQYGLDGVAALAMEKKTTAADTDTAEMYEGIAAVFTKLSEQFAKLGQELKDNANGDSHLHEVGDFMIRISKGRPASFTDALGLEYMMWQIRPGCAGRMDYHLREFFLQDTEAGVLTEERALALIVEVWHGMNLHGSGDTLTNVMVGGLDENGNDTSTRLSVLMLKAIAIEGGTEPHISVRVHKNMRQDLLDEMIAIQLLGIGQATLYNDDVVIDMLCNYGVSRSAAAQYTTDGCTEIVLDGLSQIEFSHIDVVGTFELAFNNGKYTKFDRTPVPYFHKTHERGVCLPNCISGFESGSFDEYKTFEEVYEAFLRQYMYQLDYKMNSLLNAFRASYGECTGSLLANGTYETVMQSGKNIFSGGLPELDYMVFSGSIPTAADCLIGLKRVVFDTGHYTVAEVRAALEANFVGYEKMQAEMRAAPKFGCDIDEVDLLAADIAEKFCRRIQEFNAEHPDFRLFPALVGWIFLREGYAVAATPDGRNYSEPIAEHYNATPGRAVMGPTAVIRSVAKAPLYLAAGTAATHITLSADMCRDPEESKALLRALNLAAADMGLVFLNIGIYDGEKLLDAQKHPERYEDLVVRVWGFSARFVDLATEMQNHVIARIMK